MITALVIRAQKGDDSALGEIIQAVQQKLFRFCFHLKKEANGAEDLCQEALVKALQQLKSLKEPATFQSWLFRIARNHFLDEVRRPGHSAELLQRETEDGGVREDTVADPTSEERSPQARMEVLEALHQLEPEDRDLLILIDVEDYSYLEASEVIGISESAVRSRLHRARKLLLEIVEKE